MEIVSCESHELAQPLESLLCKPGGLGLRPRTRAKVRGEATPESCPQALIHALRHVCMFMRAHMHICMRAHMYTHNNR